LSSKSGEDLGSAVVDFVLVLVPVSLLALPLMGLTALMHLSLVNQQVAYDVARFGSLADSSDSSTHSYLKSIDPELTLISGVGGSSCLTSVSVTKQYSIAFWPISIPIRSSAYAQCEKP
jgi:hypothetical protein